MEDAYYGPCTSLPINVSHGYIYKVELTHAPSVSVRARRHISTARTHSADLFPSGRSIQRGRLFSACRPWAVWPSQTIRKSAMRLTDIDEAVPEDESAAFPLDFISRWEAVIRTWWRVGVDHNGMGEIPSPPSLNSSLFSISNKRGKSNSRTIANPKAERPTIPPNNIGRAFSGRVEPDWTDSSCSASRKVLQIRAWRSGSFSLEACWRCHRRCSERKATVALPVLVRNSSDHRCSWGP